ncbi:MAG: septum formation initiator family protein [Clostridiales bacterium]|nr:septum formation initiator family protein [Clostridiales bacterium]
MGLKTGTKGKRRRNQRRRDRMGNRMAIIGITLVVFSLGVVVNFKSASMKKKDQEYQIREEALMQQVEDEKTRADELEEYRIYVQTKEYVEEVAKQKLGLVNPDEILLKPSEK